jgi:hypothetical protein
MTREDLLSHPKLVAWRGCPIEYAGEGWDGIVQRMLRELDEAKLDVTIGLVKEKFGTMRVQAVNGLGCGDPRTRLIIGGAECASAYVCEQCGASRDVTTRGRWIRTLCDSCRGTMP